MTTIIETYYKGKWFRSRLEAKWAVFMDELGIVWQYEPEGFKNENEDRTYALTEIARYEVKLRQIV